MYEIRDWLLIGKFAETNNRALLEAKKITAVLQLAAPVEYKAIDSLYLDVEDGKSLDHDHIKRGVAFVREQKMAGKRVLVACGAGISRSSTFAMASLMEEEDLDLFEAYRAILTHHPEATPHPELVKSLLEYHQVEMALMDIFDKLFKVKREVLRG